MSYYELWDGQSGNRIGEYPSMDAAREAIRRLIRRYGPESRELRTLGLISEDEKGDVQLIAQGAALIDLTQAPV